MLNLEGHLYTDPAVFALEREKIFKRTWQPLASATQLANVGDTVAADIAGWGVFIIRGQDGQLRGFHNVCSHRGARLLEPGRRNCDHVVCPYHHWQYDDHGALEDTPWYGDASPFDLAKLSLQPISVAVWRGLIFAAIEPATSLEQQLGDLPDELANASLEQFVATTGEELEAAINWKAYVDQFCEYYHVPAVHSPDKTVSVRNYEAIPRNGMMYMRATDQAGTQAAYYGGKWLWAWPNWTLSLFPGGMKISRINPVSADKIRVRFDYFFADTSQAGEPTRSRVAGATKSIFLEDVRACERAQAGYASGSYRPGPLHPQHEQATAYFQSRVREALR